MNHEIQFVLNGQVVRVRDASVNVSLLEYLRRCGLTGAKEGCAEGDCGACTVLLVEHDAEDRSSYHAVNSCLMPLCLLAGREVVTIEGIGKKGDLHPVQRAFIEQHGSQCGYCTPGVLLSLLEAYDRNKATTPEDLERQFGGNLCRCAGYRSIRDAAIVALKGRRTGIQSCSTERRIAQVLEPVRYANDGEHFFRPTSLSELLKLLEAHPAARVVAGATELGLVVLKTRKSLGTLISLEAVPELREISATKTAWQIGAAATLTEIDETVGDEWPVIREMLGVFGSRQIRNRATMGGNLVTASPIGDSAPVLLALDASVVLVSAQAERTLPLEQFFVAYRQTALKPGELLKTILIPRADAGSGTSQPAQPGSQNHSAFYKVSKRRDVDISTVAACFAVNVEAGRVRRARLAYGGVAPTPARALKTEAALLRKPWTQQTIDEVLPILHGEFTPISDVRGSAEYRRGLIGSLIEKFYESTTTCGNGSMRTEPPLKAWLPTPQADSSPPHESARNHVTGEAIYVDDQAMTRGCLEVWPVCAPYARARILKRDAGAARQMPGVCGVLLAEDVPGRNDIGIARNDEILLADREVFFHGQIVALVVGESEAACRRAAEAVVIEYEPLTPLISLQEAIKIGSFSTDPVGIRRGNCEQALQAAPLKLEGEIDIGGQEHFYLETQSAWAEPVESGAMTVVSSTQHPSEVQSVVARVLGLPANKVVVQCPRIGGGFGGKETQAAFTAALAALAARHTGKPVRIHLSRDQDMMLMGHRHPFRAWFEVGFDHDGLLEAARVKLWSDGGWALDLSQAIMERALFHLDNAYYIPAVDFSGQVARTNKSSNTAMRGFGGPQGMLVIEEILDRVARTVGLPPEVVRERNLYRGQGETSTTHYGQAVDADRIQAVWRELKETSEFVRRRAEIDGWNAAHPHTKRGLAITPMKFGISFTISHLNQAGALVLIYRDGTIQVNHSGTEMGQGLHTNICAIAARELGVPLSQVRVMPTSTDKVPNTSATAASVGTDLNGAAVKNACEILRARLRSVAGDIWREKFGGAPKPEELLFADGQVSQPGRTERRLSFGELVQRAYEQRVSLAATGFYATPDIHWNKATGRGRPFHYFAHGAAVTEVEIDEFTGMHRVLRVDILQDAGDAINEAVNRGQVEGGFVQGMGWLTSEELIWDEAGRLLTHGPDTYKIPTLGDIPPVFNVKLLQHAAEGSVVYGSKAIGEPPLMLALSVREALRDAVAAFANRGPVPLPTPATGEAIFLAIQRLKPEAIRAGLSAEARS